MVSPARNKERCKLRSLLQQIIPRNIEDIFEVLLTNIKALAVTKRNHHQCKSHVWARKRTKFKPWRRASTPKQIIKQEGSRCTMYYAFDFRKLCCPLQDHTNHHDMIRERRERHHLTQASSRLPKQSAMPRSTVAYDTSMEMERHGRRQING
jgi:hypothetical protein